MENNEIIYTAKMENPQNMPMKMEAPKKMPMPMPTSMPMALDDMPLAMAYVPMQKWQKVYEAEVGIDRGTIFSELDLPFLGAEGVK